MPISMCDLHGATGLQPPMAQRGFTLLEVLVAMAILSLAIGVLMSGMGGATRLWGTASQHEVAMQLAQAKLEEYLNQPGGQLSAEADDLTYGGVKYGFRLESTPIDKTPARLQVVTSNQTVLNKVAVVVFWGTKPNLYQYSVTTFQRRKAVP